MQLSGLSVKNYRSIKQTPRLSFGELAVLVGPNNEGKSNILRAAVMGMRILRRFGMMGSAIPTSPNTRISSRQYYDWFEDYPKDLQEKTPNGSTIIDFWFELDDKEKSLFKSRIGVSLKTELPIRLTVNRHVDFTVRKQGPGKETLNRKSAQVASFVGRHLRIEYVGSVRTADDATDVIREILRERITEALDAEQYDSLVSQLSVAVTNAIKPLSIELRETLKDFIPDISDVRIQVTEEGILDRLIDETKVLIDDGAETDLRYKGDGVQSLAALAMARKAADIGRRSLILAIEEPEAHLHPSAVHRVRQVVNEIASKQQVIYTTHSPLLVDRFKLSNNVIVRGSKATPAKTLNELREVLGVRTSDNLAQAALVLIVEGLTDRNSIESLIMSKSPKLSAHIASGALALDHLKGASNLLSKLDGLRQQLCQYHVLLDHDNAGLIAGKKARDAGLLSIKEETYSIVPSMKESEFEDTLNVELYKGEVANAFGVSLDVVEFKREKAKWGDRIEATFRSQGKVYDSNVGAQVKMLVSRLVTESPESALHPRRASSIEALCVQLENRIDEMDF
ncbi:AAA family ATPase [Streptomyces sp. OUCMDZ-4982]|uniref:ATP-dependent nuclease n=1 Tax=Streptomyces sp. OUCMDZ-4982 TaxID=2973090 RepID=UPI00215C36E9|nr:AAA family ATPase [Streptomyces sp. OUCMDZ-4982]MCR8944956.1 AAA family ATPase [Streptomyces sp. OUCMDZ-4982]